MERRDLLLAHAAALTAAALVPAGVAAALWIAGGNSAAAAGVAAFGAGLGLILALLLGLPAYLVLRGLGRAGLWTSLLAGALVGAAPLLLLSLSVPDQASVGGVPTVIDGRRTAAGWAGVARMLGSAAAVGACAGGAFWLVLRWTGALRPQDPGRTSSPPSSKRSRVAAGAAMVALVTTAALPTLTADRSCHNPFQNGARSIVPILGIRLDLAEADWPRLAEVLGRFAERRSLEFRNQSETEPGVVSVLALSACRPGLIVGADKQVWRGHDMGPAFEGVDLLIFQVSREAEWRPTAAALIDELERTWPGRVGFIDGMDRPISRAQVMRGRSEGGPAE